MERRGYSHFVKEYIKNPYFCSIESSFIADRFNLVGTECYLKNQSEAHSILLSNNPHKYSDKSPALLEEAILLYGMIHARYIHTTAGLSQIAAKFDHGVYGFCPRVHCNNQKLLPVGLSSVPGVVPVNHYCCSCEDVYSTLAYDRPPYADSAFFGRTHIYLFFKRYPEKLPSTRLETYVPRIYGFKVKKYSDEDKVRKRLRDIVGEGVQRLRAEDNQNT